MDDAPVLQAESRNLIPVLPEDRKLDATFGMLTILWPAAALPAPRLTSPFFGQRFSAWLNCTDTVLVLIHSTARFVIWLIILIALWDPVMVVVGVLRRQSHHKGRAANRRMWRLTAHSARCPSLLYAAWSLNRAVITIRHVGLTNNWDIGGAPACPSAARISG